MDGIALMELLKYKSFHERDKTVGLDSLDKICVQQQ